MKTGKTYRIPSARAVALADTFDALSDELKTQYPEMAGLAAWLRTDAARYPTVMVALHDDDCVPYPGAPDICSEGVQAPAHDIAGRVVVSDGYGS